MADGAAPDDPLGLAGTTLAERYCVDRDLACGRHQLEFKRPDLQIDQTEAILINPGETFKRRFTLSGGPE